MAAGSAASSAARSTAAESGRPAAIAELLPDDVDAGDELGHAVLDLEAGVDLEEPEVAGLVEEELGGRGVARPAARAARTASSWRWRRSSAERPGAGASSTASGGGAGASSRARRGRRRADRVAEELDLDVAGGPDLALEIDRAVAERGERLGGGGGERRRQLLGAATRRIPRPPPPAAALTSSGKPTRSASASDALELVRPVDRRLAQRARHDRHAGRGGRPTGGELVAEGERSSPRTDRRRRARHPRRPGRTRLARRGSRSRDGSPPPRWRAPPRRSRRSAGSSPAPAAGPMPDRGRRRRGRAPASASASL